ncbi:MAG TPA: peptidoglycan-binding protein LysM [Trinickia sp.]|uniref:CIS tube protein n=1 Tax=Trinickia sp. TaxID=2571163 RepID=UPI002CE8085E|nr:peptidoglycan-binding protein LysM [Trinickia sp.]HVW51138.1 peptidoglycan-binding protein LysM [Trinickia sp.]
MLPRHSKSSLLAKLLPSSLHHASIHIENAHRSQMKVSSSLLKVMYNPETLSLNQSARVTGEGNKVWFSRTQPGDLQVDLFFDTYEEQSDVRKLTNDILALTEPWPAKKGAKVPPTVRFMWADCMFTGIVTQVGQKFTMFLPSGVPVRAELGVTFTEVLTDAEEITAQGLDNCRTLVNVIATDRLGSIAYNALGDSTQWRLIADANGIYDPIAFPGRMWIGQTIAIPDTHNETFEPAGASDYV